MPGCAYCCALLVATSLLVTFAEGARIDIDISTSSEVNALKAGEDPKSGKCASYHFGGTSNVCEITFGINKVLIGVAAACRAINSLRFVRVL